MVRSAVAAIAALVLVAACSSAPPDAPVSVPPPFPVGSPVQPPPAFVGVRPGPSPNMGFAVPRSMAAPKPKPAKCKFPLRWRPAHRVPVAGGTSRYVRGGCY